MRGEFPEKGLPVGKETRPRSSALEPGTSSAFRRLRSESRVGLRIAALEPWLLEVRISGPPRPVTLRSKVGKGLRGAGVWGGAPVYTSPAPDLQPEQAEPERACGIEKLSFDPGRGCGAVG